MEKKEIKRELFEKYNWDEFFTEMIKEDVWKWVEDKIDKAREEEREKIIDEIEMKLLNWQEVEIPSKEIGKMIMEKLKKVDQMAYIRFATVYLDFNSINDFEKLLVDLKNNG